MDQYATWYGGRPWPMWHCVRWDPALPHGKRHSYDSSPHFSAYVHCGQTVAHLSNCWALVITHKLGIEAGYLGPAHTNSNLMAIFHVFLDRSGTISGICTVPGSWVGYMVAFAEHDIAVNARIEECLRAHQLCVFLRVRLCDAVCYQPLCAAMVKS